jgi:MipA family protein
MSRLKTICALCVWAVWLIGAASGSAIAQTAQPVWELGGVGVAVSQQAYPGANTQQKAALIAPYMLYRGEYFRVNRDGLGLRALKTPDFELDLGFSGALGSNSNTTPARVGMPNLGTLIEFGPNAKWFLNDRSAERSWRLDVPLRGVFNLSHQFRHEGWVLEPNVVIESKPKAGWRYSASAGVLLGDAQTNALFYSVDNAYVTASRPAYSAKSGLIAYKVGATLTYSLSPDLSIFGFARLNTVNGASNQASPLVQKNSGASYGIGLVYLFAKSSELTKN